MNKRIRTRLNYNQVHHYFYYQKKIKNYQTGSTKPTKIKDSTPIKSNYMMKTRNSDDEQNANQMNDLEKQFKP